MNSAGACPASQSVVREAHFRSGRQLFLDAAHHDASDDVLRQEQINQDNRENGERDHRINLAHVELQPVRCTKLCNQDRQGLFVGAVQHQSGNEVVVPAGHEGEDGLPGGFGL